MRIRPKFTQRSSVIRDRRAVDLRYLAQLLDRIGCVSGFHELSLKKVGHTVNKKRTFFSKTGQNTSSTGQTDKKINRKAGLDRVGDRQRQRERTSTRPSS